MDTTNICEETMGQIAATTSKDSEGRDLIPGRVYCMVEFKTNPWAKDPADAKYESHEALAYYGADGRFYDANYDDCAGNDISHYDFDKLVLQPGNINPEYAAMVG